MPSNTDAQVDAVNGVLKIRKPKFVNKFHISGPRFLTYLKAYLFGLVLCSMEDPEDIHWFTMSAVLEYVDTFDHLVIRGANND